MERTDNYDYADRMRALREDKDLKQIQVAELLHVGQKTYSDYETRKIRIPLESMIKLAKFCNVDLNYICGISNEKRNYPLE